jgi:hypothetical protein
MKRNGLIALALATCIAIPLTGLSASTLSWEFTLERSQVRLQETEAGAVQPMVEGFPMTECLDYPALPYRTVSILLPQGEEVSSYRLDVLSEGVLRPSKPLAPFKGRYRDDGAMIGITPDAYGARGEIFPAENVRYFGSSSYRGYRIASFAIYPVRFDAGTKGLDIEERVRLVVETSPASSSDGVAERNRRIDGFREKSRRRVEQMVINPEAAAGYVFNEVAVGSGGGPFLPSYEPSMEGSAVAYVIVTSEALAPAFQRLADSKTAKGVPAVVRTIEWIQQNYRWGADVGESIRNFIREAYAKWGVEWVLLGGDTDVVPARFGYVTFTEGDLVPTDMYYSCLDGSWNADHDSLWGEAFHSTYDPGDNADLYPEVYVGRMPVSTLAEANTLIDKTMNYEAATDTLSKKKFLMLGEVIFPTDYPTNPLIVLDGAEVTDDVYESYLEGNPNAVTTRLYENYTAYPGALQETKARCLDSLNAGVNHVLHAGHGSSYNMSVGEANNILNYDADQLTNGNALFSMYIMSCKNGAFDTECLAEAFLLNDTGGAFAVTASSRSAYPSASRPYLDEYYSLLFTENVVHLGELQTLSRIPFTPAAGGETADRWTHFICNYLGDPEVCMSQGRMRAFAVSKPSSAHFGPNDISIQVTSGGVPFDSAYVCLYKEGDDYAYGSTGSSGTILFQNFLCKTTGSITVTVTGLNQVRYSGTIPVTQATGAYLRVSDTHVLDTVIGNNDGVLDAGETVNLRVKLKNTGEMTASKLYAIIRSSDPEIAVSDSTALYPTIASGAEAWGNDDFRFGVSASVPDEHVVQFTIDVHDSTGHFWSEKFAFEVHAPKLELYVNTARDTLPYGNNNGTIEEGEQFLLKIGIKNFGTGKAYGLQGKIRSLDPDIVVSDSVSNYSSLPLLGVSYGDGFVLAETTIGSVNYYRFILTDAYGRTLTKRMELRKPGAPKTVVLDSRYGPTEIQATWRRPDSLEAYRYQVRHATTSGGPYTVANKDLVAYTLYRDRELLSSTRYYYRISAVDSCGNEGALSAEYTATTSPPQLTGWPQKVSKESSSSIRIGDVDGDMRPDVVVGSDYVHAWHADGIELRDGDGQPLTWGIFNTYGNTFTATVALAPLDGAPGLEIVGASWNTRQIFVFKKDGSVLAGWPKTTTNLCWASPVVGDIDGDGDLEIVAYDVAGIVYAWHRNGVEVRNGDNNPATDGPFFVTKNPGTWHMSTPAVADMDGDGVVELIVCSPADSIYCLNGNGSRVPGWPVKVLDVNANITASPAVGDVDGDGHPEVIVQSSTARVYGLNHDGTVMAGWPVWVYSNTGTIAPSPALADLDGDGKLEVVIAGLDKKCYVFKYDGTPYPGWPQTYGTTAATESSPIVGDIDGDHSPDIILACEEGRVHAWRSNGQYIVGFPIDLKTYVRGTPVVSDLDLDGNVELAAMGWDRNLNIWHLTGEWYAGCTEWNGFHANTYNTGWKDFRAATAAGQVSCVYRIRDEGVELHWSVFPEVSSWRLSRAASRGDFELIAAGLRGDREIDYVDGTAEEGVAYRYRLEAEGQPDLFSTTEEIMVPVREMCLYQNHPNPFNPSTTIPFTVPGAGGSRRNVFVAIYDVDGSLVKTLANGALAAGRHEAFWDGRNERGESVASGIYFVRLSSGSFEAARKLVLLR